MFVKFVPMSLCLLQRRRGGCVAGGRGQPSGVGKVLSHYRDEPLKLRAARFLIENMDAHYCYGGKAVDGYYHDMDSLFTHKEGDRGFLEYAV